jgi:hypothetical protein
MTANEKKSLSQQINELVDSSKTKLPQGADELLLEELRARQKLLDPNKFSNRKVTIK